MKRSFTRNWESNVRFQQTDISKTVTHNNSEEAVMFCGLNDNSVQVKLNFRSKLKCLQLIWSSCYLSRTCPLMPSPDDRILALILLSMMSFLSFQVVGYNFNVALELYFKTVTIFNYIEWWGTHWQWEGLVVCSPLLVISHVVWKPQSLKDSRYKTGSCVVGKVKKPGDFAGHVECKQLYLAIKLL